MLQQNPIIAVRNVEVFINGQLPNEEYHKREGISSSGLYELFSDCPEMFKFGEKDDGSAALHFGTASHAAMLEPDLFDSLFVRGISKEDFKDQPLLTSEDAIRKWITAQDRKGASTRKGQELIDFAMETAEIAKCEPPLIFSVLEKKHAEANAGKTIVKSEDYDNIIKMRKRLFADVDYANMLKDAYYETSVLCEIQIEGCDDWIKVKARPDIVTKDCLVPDYKTTRDVRPSEFGRLAYYGGYWFRQAFVCDILSAVYSTEFKAGLLAQGKVSPFIPQMYMMTKQQIGAGRSEYYSALRVYAKCLRDNVWPAYADGPLDLDTPGYVAKNYGFDV